MWGFERMGKKRVAPKNESALVERVHAPIDPASENIPAQNEARGLATIGELREKLKESATKAFNKEKIPEGSMARAVATYSAEASYKTFSDLTIAAPNHLRVVLENAGREIEKAMSQIKTGAERDALSEEEKAANDAAFAHIRQEGVKDINIKYSVEIAKIIFPNRHEPIGGGEYKEIHDTNPENVRAFIEKQLNFATIAEVTRRQLGLKETPQASYELLDEITPKLTDEEIEQQKEGWYQRKALNRMKEYILRDDPKPRASERDVVLSGYLLTLPNAVWAVMEPDVARFLNRPDRLNRPQLDTPEGRSQALYESEKAKAGYAAIPEGTRNPEQEEKNAKAETIAFAKVAYINAEDFANFFKGEEPIH